jgi:hypothetical protein
MTTPCPPCGFFAAYFKRASTHQTPTPAAHAAGFVISIEGERAEILSR